MRNSASSNLLDSAAKSEGVKCESVSDTHTLPWNPTVNYKVIHRSDLFLPFFTVKKSRGLNHVF